MTKNRILTMLLAVLMLGMFADMVQATSPAVVLDGQHWLSMLHQLLIMVEHLSRCGQFFNHSVLMLRGMVKPAQLQI